MTDHTIADPVDRMLLVEAACGGTGCISPIVGSEIFRLETFSCPLDSSRAGTDHNVGCREKPLRHFVDENAIAGQVVDEGPDGRDGKRR